MTSSNPLVTIVVAAYRTPHHYLRTALAGAVAQTFGDWELIVTDDSPSDDLRRVAEEFQDDRIPYLHNAPSLGIDRNHWRGIGAARGSLIAVLNHDDEYLPQFLERLALPLAADPSLSAAFCDHWVMDSDGNNQPEITEAHTVGYGRSTLPAGVHRPWRNLLVAQTVPIAMGAVLRKSELGDMAARPVGPAYDLWLGYLLCRHSAGIYYVPERLSRWRAFANNATTRGDASWPAGAAETWQAIASDDTFRPWRDFAQRKTATAYYHAARSAWRAGHHRQTLAYGWNSLRARPSLRGAAACLLALVPNRLDRRASS